GSVRQILQVDRGSTHRQDQIRASSSILHRHCLQVRGPELDHHRQRHPVHRQEVHGVLRQFPHMCGLVGCGTPTDERASGACQRHDPPRTKAKNLQQAEQVRPEVAHGATLGHLEPEDDPKQSYGFLSVLPRLWRRGHPPHRLGIRITKAQGISRATKPANSRRLAGLSGRGSRHGAPPLCALPAVFTKVSSAEGPAPRPQRRGLGAKASTGQQGPPQDLTSMGRTVHNRRGAQARHVQASQRKRQSPHQRLEYTTATSFLPLAFQAISILFVIAFSISRNNKEAHYTYHFLGTFPTLEGSGAHEHRGTLGFTLGKAEPPSGATTGGTPERPQKVASFFRNISVSILSFSYPWKKRTRGVSNYGTGLAESWGRLRLRDMAPPHHPTPTLLMNANFLADVYLSRI